MNTGPCEPDTRATVIILPDVGPPTHPRFLFDPADLILGESMPRDPALAAPAPATFSRGVSLGMMVTRRVAESARRANCRINRHLVAVCAVALAWSVDVPVVATLPVVTDRRMSMGRGAHRMTVWAHLKFWRAVDARRTRTGETLSACVRALFDGGRIIADGGRCDGMTVPWLFEPWGYDRQERWRKK